MIELKNLSLQYRGSKTQAISHINLTVKRGDLVLITGPTGCGKSTLLSCLNGIMQHESSAIMKGQVKIDSNDISQISMSEICQISGTVFQNPDSQICTALVESEIAFGLENRRMEQKEMLSRIKNVLEITGLNSCRFHETRTLSGGQKQRLMIACALALEPKILLLDEPASQLDPKGTKEIMAVIQKLKKERDLTVVLVEHRVEETIQIADQIVVMDQGRIVENKPREESIKDLTVMRNLGLNLPQLVDFFETLNRPERPLKAEDAPLVDVTKDSVEKKMAADKTKIGEIKNLYFRYEKKGTDLIKNINLEFYQGECIALMGSNGAGKSTLLHLLAGRTAPISGNIIWAKPQNPVKGLLLQEPDLMLFMDSVEEELAFSLQQKRVSSTEMSQTVERTIHQLGLEDFRHQAPFSLSRGQRLRTALASILTLKPSILLLDEPTTGQDRRQIEKMMTNLVEQVDLLIFCTHSVEVAAKWADRIVLMEKGEIVAEGNTNNVLLNKKVLESASIRQSVLLEYINRLGISVTTKEELLKRVR